MSPHAFLSISPLRLILLCLCFWITGNVQWAQQQPHQKSNLYIKYIHSSWKVTIRPADVFWETRGMWYTANVYRDLQGLCRGFLQYLQGKPCNIYRFICNPPAICKFFPAIPLQSVNITGFSLQILQKTPRRVPVNPCKHLQCTVRTGPQQFWK